MAEGMIEVPPQIQAELDANKAEAATLQEAEHIVSREAAAIVAGKIATSAAEVGLSDTRPSEQIVAPLPTSSQAGLQAIKNRVGGPQF